MRAAIYARYSTDKQDKKTSIGAQIENCTVLAKRHGFTIDKAHIFQDHALSGAKVDRPGYAALKQAVKEKRVDVILADETSRLTRVTSELLALGELLQQQRPKMHLVTCDGIDTQTDGWEWLLLIKAGVDSQERRKIGFRVYSRLRQRHDDGKSAGGKAYGYTHEQDGDYRVKVLVKDEAKIVRRVFTMFADGMTHRQVAYALNAEGIPSPGATWKRTDKGENSKRHDGKWMGTTIYSMLRNPLYRGDVIWNRAEFYLYTDPDTGKTTRKRNERPRAEWLERHDEALRIVPEELWRRCEKRRTATKERHAKQKHPGGRPRQRLFNLVCDECGGCYVMLNGRQLVCATHRGGGPKACKNGELIKVDHANRVLVQELCNCEDGLLSDGTLADVRRHMTQHVQKLKREAARESGTAANLRALLVANETNQENVADAMQKHGYTDVLAKRLKKLEQERHELEAKLAAAGGGKLDSLPDIVPDTLQRYRDQVAALATPNHGLSVQQLVKARGLIDEVLEPVRVNRDLVARLTLAHSLVAGVGFEPTTFGL